MPLANTFELNPDTVIVASSRQRASLLNNETVVLNLDNEQYYILNDSATAIWSHIQQPIAWETLHKNSQDSYQEETTAFLLNLIKIGLLIKTDDPEIARDISLSIASTPTITCMGGMKELVAMAGSAGDEEDGNLDPGTETGQDNSASGVMPEDFTTTFPGGEILFDAPNTNDPGVGDDVTGRPED